MTSLRRLPFALRALFAVVALIALFAYVISAWQVFGFARFVWQLPFVLCFGAAVVADLLSLSGLFATYLLREANWHVRAYAWVVFLLMTGLSIAAAESFAEWRRLTEAQQRAYSHIDAQFAAGAIVVALALAVHLLIVCVRHVDVAERALDRPARPAARPVRTPAPAPAEPRRRWWTRKRQDTPTPAPAPLDVPELVTDGAFTQAGPISDAVPLTAPDGQAAKPRRTAPKQEQASRRGRPVDPVKQAEHDRVAARVVAGTVTTTQAAAEQGVSTKSVQNWVASFRERHPDRTARRDLATPMLGPDDQAAETGKPQLAEGVHA
jgi:hypothetical protein